MNDLKSRLDIGKKASEPEDIAIKTLKSNKDRKKKK